ncbi:MAG: MotA/TolQ/ExbB proton channel family protein [Myxococcota bacterium]
MRPVLVLLSIVVAAAAAAAQTPDVAAAATPPARSLADWYAMGGPIMHVLVLCSVLVVAISLERLFALRAGAVMPRALARELFDLARARDTRGALARCDDSRTPLASLARIGVEELGRSDLHGAERAVEAAAASEVARLSRNLSLLSAIANLATLLGLLGTVLGMIEAFEMIALQGSGDAGVVAGGIFRALVTTAAGLSVGITAFAIHALFKRRVETWIERMEDDLSALLHAFGGAGTEEAPDGLPAPEAV